MIISSISVLFEAVLANPFYMAWGGLVHHALPPPEASRILGGSAAWRWRRRDGLPVDAGLPAHALRPSGA